MLVKKTARLRRSGHPIGGITMKTFHLISATGLSSQPGSPLDFGVIDKIKLRGNMYEQMF
jgi:hypothetical protein